jgi:serine/threonine protein kinase
LERGGEEVSLSASDKLGPYEILALIGKGGMGEVYRARDPRLNRDVAIKISNAQFTERFTREARAIAALNHTNICHLYDVGPDYLVMEYVEGQDLRGPMDIEDALPIIQQLIDGIEAAHEKNIVHRDLKPANIKITPEGVVKILDFGLAKAMEPPSDNSNPENSPTLTMGATVAGTILGTAAYMAPEQAKGKTADKRSDIWSFGVIVYEMLTGKRLFQGESAVEILSGVLNQEPDINAAPVRVHRLLRWCLEKDRKQRLASISDARRLLVENEPTSASDAPSRSRFGWVAWGLAVSGCTAAVSLAAWMFLRPVPLPEVTRFEIHAPEGNTLPLGPPAPSPDGRTIAYTLTGKDGVTRIHVRSMDSTESRVLPGTERARRAFWSPDGRSLAFVADDNLKRIDLAGGSAHALTQTSATFQGSWNRDGVILFGGASLITAQIPDDGGVAAPVAKLDEKKGETGVAFPDFLSDGKRFLVLVGHRDGRNSIELASLGSLERTIVIPDSALSAPILAPTPGGKTYLLYLRDTSLVAQEYDEASGKVRGSAVVLVGDIGRVGGGGARPAAGVSPTGILAYQNGNGASQSGELAWFDRSGKRLSQLPPRGSRQQSDPIPRWTVRGCRRRVHAGRQPRYSVSGSCPRSYHAVHVCARERVARMVAGWKTGGVPKCTRRQARDLRQGCERRRRGTIAGAGTGDSHILVPGWPVDSVYRELTSFSAPA